MRGRLIAIVAAFTLWIPANAPALSQDDGDRIRSAVRSLQAFIQGKQDKETLNGFAYYGPEGGALESDLETFVRFTKNFTSVELADIKAGSSDRFAEVTLNWTRKMKVYKANDRWYLVDTTRREEGEYATRAYDSRAKFDLRNMQTLQEAYYVDHRRYADSIGKLLEANPDIQLSGGVQVTIKRADDKGYAMEAHHSKGSLIYLVSGPGGEVREKGRRMKVTGPAGAKETLLSETEKELIRQAFDAFSRFSRGSRDKDTLEQFVYFGPGKQATPADVAKFSITPKSDNRLELREIRPSSDAGAAEISVSTMEPSRISKINGQWHIFDMEKSAHSDMAMRSYHTRAQSALKAASTAQEAYFVDHKKYADSLDKLRAKSYGLKIPDGVRVSVRESSATTYTMEASHVRGTKTFIVSGPGGTVKENQPAETARKPFYDIKSRQDCDALARRVLKNAATSQESYYVDNRRYTDSLDKLCSKEYGLEIPDGVRVSIQESSATTYAMEASHVGGTKKFTLSGPGGTIQQK